MNLSEEDRRQLEAEIPRIVSSLNEKGARVEITG